MKIKGKVWKFGADINTDLILPARHLVSTDPQELASHCMEDEDADFARKVNKGDIIIADKNFGCGSSREHAPIAIKAIGVGCVIASSFARIFYRNAFNIGLPIFECAEAYSNVEEGDEVSVDMSTGEIINVTKNEKYKTGQIPPFMQELIDDGGLLPHIAKELTN